MRTSKHTNRMRRFIFLLMAIISVTIAHPQDVTGSWKGVLDLGQAKLNLVFNIAKDDAGKLTCTMDSPDQGAKGIPAEIAMVDETKLKITVGAIGMTYDGELKDGEIKGTFSQNGFSAQLDLKPGTVELNRPQTPQPPFPYTTEEVTFTNTIDNAVLCGTLTIPASSGKVKSGKMPVVVMVTGSGQQNRDEEVFGHKPFLVLADFLARHGIASLRYDDRGTGKSTGDVANATTENNMKDALAAIDFVRKSGCFGKTGVLGHSEGGCIAFLIGGAGKADFIVSMAGTAVRGDSVLIDQNKRMLAMSGFPLNICTDYCRALQGVFDSIRAGKGSDEAENTVKDVIMKTGANLPVSLSRNLVEVIRTINPWLKYFISCDPQESISKIKCPVMAVNGNRDTQVSASTNLNALCRLLPHNKYNNVKEYDGLNHLFQHCTTGGVNEYGQIEETMSPEVMADIANWIREVSK